MTCHPIDREENMTTLTLQITGMTCDHCARSAEEALNALAGVRASPWS